MPSYDSDSSDGGDDYTETSVLLGYASTEPTGDIISHIGGQPSWIDDKTPPSGALAKCKVCNDYLTLLLELNGDLPEQFPGHERRIYIWSCRRKTCRRKEGSVRGTRGVRIAKGVGKKPNAKTEKKIEERKEVDAPQPKIGESLFGVTKTSTTTPANPFSNPFSTASNGIAPANHFSSPSASAKPFAVPSPSSSIVKATPDQVEAEATTTLTESFADKVRLSSPAPSAHPPRPHEPWPEQSAFPPAYPPYALDAEYETLDAPSTPQIPHNARGMDVDMEGGSGSKEDKDVYESTIDKTFQKFADRIGENAEQVLRYEFKGKPLLYSDSDAVGKLLMPHSEHGSSSNTKITTTSSRSGVGIPRCPNCGADRVFEVQLTPHLITELEADEMSIDGMEWGTVVLGVCGKDCGPSDIAEGEVGYVEEWVGVQWEEVNSKR